MFREVLIYLNDVFHDLSPVYGRMTSIRRETRGTEQLVLGYAAYGLGRRAQPTRVLENAFRASVMDVVLAADQPFLHGYFAPGAEAIGDRDHLNSPSPLR